MPRRLREDVRTALAKLPGGRYRTILADPPWAWMRGGSSVKGTVSAKTGKTCVGAQGATPYQGMSTKELLALGAQVRRVAAADAHLYLWTVNKTFPDAVCLVREWGFRWVSVVTWDKQKPGLAKYFQGVTKHCVFAVRGAPPYKFIDGKMAQGRTLVSERMTDHSRKPESLRKVIERVSYGPRLELFARRCPGDWDAVGLELEV